MGGQGVGAGGGRVVGAEFLAGGAAAGEKSQLIEPIVLAPYST
jgi:hypothetical protein